MSADDSKLAIVGKKRPCYRDSECGDILRRARRKVDESYIEESSLSAKIYKMEKKLALVKSRRQVDEKLLFKYEIIKFLEEHKDILVAVPQRLLDPFYDKKCESELSPIISNDYDPDEPEVVWANDMELSIPTDIKCSSREGIVFNIKSTDALEKYKHIYFEFLIEYIKKYSDDDCSIMVAFYSSK